MKKLILMLFATAICTALFVTPALAAAYEENQKGDELSDIYTSESETAMENESIDFIVPDLKNDEGTPYDESIAAIPNQGDADNVERGKNDWDLKDGQADIDVDIGAEGSKLISYRLKTNTTKMYVYLFGTPSGKITVELQDENLKTLQVCTKDVNEFVSTKFYFPNLTASQRYRLYITNETEEDMSVSGYVKA